MKLSELLKVKAEACAHTKSVSHTGPQCLSDELCAHCSKQTF